MYELRQSGDYDDMYDITEEEVVSYMESTELFVAKMESLMTL